MAPAPSRRKVPLWIQGLVVLGLFAAVVAGEALLRKSQDRLLIGRAEGGPWPLRVEGRVGPDFLWMGERWSLTITNEGTVALAGCTVTFDEGLDSASPTFTLWPGGSETYYWNHDHATAPHALPARVTLWGPAAAYSWKIERAR
jgi:hypothetical protein